ncbi:MAG: 4-(cytidine 5'-diphospho)-2-C-methyl-D-erythritol kinase [Clostridia bacterium]|nr:4-(cytidine 5'-diphospho)-2-C-methyl-D-erythritol kinase [Clostridia bacterium]
MIFNRAISDKAYAKINLYLDVTKKRDDGFHDIKSIMQSVSLCDELEIRLSEQTDNSLICNVPGIPTDSSNLIIKATDAYRKAINKSFGIHINLNKMIPSSAGLAGGSSDAAATLRILNKLNKKPLDEPMMLEIATSVGSDVPFCYVGGTVLCEGRGEKLTRLDDCPNMHIVIAIKGDGVSTPIAYKAVDETYGDFSSSRDEGRIEKLLVGLKESNNTQIYSGTYNIFESVVEKERPFVGQIKSCMLNSGAVISMMSGSGPSVFGIFTEEKQAENAKKSLISAGANAYICKTQKRTP